jgi:hypothetical protein
MFLLDRAAPFLLALAVVLLLPLEAFAAVGLDILVIEAKKSGKPNMPAKLTKMKLDDDLKDLGYRSAKLLDQLDATVEDDGAVTLEMATPYSKKKEEIRVKVLDRSEKVIKLRVELPSLKFKADTSHTNGAALLLVPRRTKASALILAIRPRP